MMTPEAVAYAWRELERRAGIAGGLADAGVRTHYGSAATCPAGAPAIVVVPCAPDAWTRLAGQAPRLGERDGLPVVFWGDGADESQAPFVDIRGEQLIFQADILAATVFMLTRWEEIGADDSDEHGRFPAAASAAYRCGYLDRPIVDEYALVLRSWLRKLLPRWRPQPGSFSVTLGHDIDFVRPFDDARTAVRAVAGDVLKRRSLPLAWRHAVEWSGQMLWPAENPVFRGIEVLAATSSRHGLQSAFYFMTASRSRLDNGYDLSEPWIRAAVDDIRRQGFEIGFHAGYDTFDDFERFSSEKRRFEAIVGEGVYGGRQHYCRFKVPQTWRHWEQAGFAYDATMGYPDHEGFRCGTCHPFQVFDIERDRPLNLMEHPFVAMDGTFATYQQVSPAEAESRMRAIIARCRAVEGCFSLVWHNDMFTPGRRPWADVYARVVEACAQPNG